MLNSEELAIVAARAADEKKAADVCILDMRDKLGVTDFFVVSSGASDRQVRRITEAVRHKLKELGVRPSHTEGEGYHHWVVLDYADFVVHVFHQADREFYDLERLWKDVPLVEWEKGNAV